MQTLIVQDFDLARTLECGQIFRYEKVGDSYIVCHRDIVFKVKQEGSTLSWEGAPKLFIHSFFRLDDDYERIKAFLSKDPFLKKALAVNPGLRLIRQDPWECLISYVCSSNANIPKIKKNIIQLTQCFGKPLSLGDYSCYSFPEPGQLTTQAKIRGCGVGYRDSFIHKINSTVSLEELIALRDASYSEARTSLMRFHGVGEKVADCVCLFSLDKLEAFPVDVWIRRIMQDSYLTQSARDNEIRAFAQDHFGEYAGYANQFLFHYARQQHGAC